MPKTFKYKVLTQNTQGWFSTSVDASSLESQLNALGAKGWDLVSSFDVNGGHGASKEVVLILKKEEPASGEQSYE